MNEKADGRLTLDQFEILRELGRGGTSVVYLAADRKDGSLCAMKLLKKEDPEGIPHDSGEKTELLRAEAAVLEALGEDEQGEPHAGTRYWGIPEYRGEIWDESGGFAGFLMEYVEGKSLRELLGGGRIYSVRETAEAGLQLCGVMGRLHRQKPPMIYRDLKPANILVRADGTLALVDYGAVRKYRKSAAEDTQQLGTEGYAAPEQYGGWEQSDERTDIYGIGAVLHHMVTGRPPLETGLKPLEEILRPSGGERLPCSCTEMAQILRRCCMTAPSMRFSSCEELAKALRFVLKNCEKEEAAERRTGKGIRRSVLPVCAAAVLLLCGGAFAAITEGAEIMEYRRLIKEAGEAGELGKKTEIYGAAAGARPEETEAYICFVRDLAEDYVVTQEEKEALDSVLYGAVGRQSGEGNLERMREKRPGDYAWLEMELGKVYFACYEGGREAAGACFANALEAAGIWFDGRRTAEAMTEVLSGEWNADRIGVWIVLEREAAEEAEETGNGVFAAAVCKAAAAEIALYADRYEEAGTGRDMIKEVTQSAEEFMRKAEDGRVPVPEKLEKELRAAVDSAVRAQERREAGGESERTQIGEAE